MKEFMDKVVTLFCEMWAVEFYRGALLATGCFAAVLILYWIVKLVIFVKFGRRRCSSVSVNNEHGSIISSCDTITAVLRSELKNFPELNIRRILIYRKRGVYSIELRCVYAKVENFRGIPELFAQMEPLIREHMKNIFGMDDIAKIDIRIVGSDDFDDGSDADELSSASPEVPRV